MYPVHDETRGLNILKLLLWKDMTNKEIREAYQEKYHEELTSSAVYTYVKRLSKYDLVRTRGKKNGRAIYRSKLRESYIAFNKLLDELLKAEIPDETKATLYHFIMKILPEPLGKLMNRFVKVKAEEVLRDRWELINLKKEEFKRMYS